VYAREVEGRTLNLAIAGQLWKDGMMLYSQETKTQWVQLSGEAKRGPLKGKRLRIVPSVVTDWESWRRRYPSGSVLLLPLGRREFRRDFYHHPEDFVLGIGDGRAAKAWGLEVLRQRSVLNDQWDDRPVLVVFHAASSTAALYERTLPTGVLTFRSAGDKVVDEQGGSVWDPVTGEAESGPLRGRRLPRLPAILAKRQAWHACHPSLPAYIGRLSVVERELTLSLRPLRRSLRILVVLALLGIIALAAYPIAQSLRAAYHFRQAERALAAEELDEAGDHLAVCLELQPDSVRFHLRAAQAARRSALYDLAADHLETCERLGDKSEALRLEGAMLSFQRGEMTSYTESLLLTALDRDHADSVLVLEALARGYQGVYALEHALRCLDRWLQLRPDSLQARLQRGWVYERLDRLEDAQNDYLVVVQRRPDHAPAVARLAQLLLQQGQAAEALPWFERLRQHSEDRRAVRLDVTAEGRALLEEAQACHPDVRFAMGRYIGASPRLTDILADRALAVAR